MKKVAFAAVLLAGIIGWAIRDDASSKPDAWRDLAKQTRRDIATCVVTKFMPGVLKADCL